MEQQVYPDYPGTVQAEQAVGEFDVNQRASRSSFMTVIDIITNRTGTTALGNCKRSRTGHAARGFQISAATAWAKGWIAPRAPSHRKRRAGCAQQRSKGAATRPVLRQGEPSLSADVPGEPTTLLLTRQHYAKFEIYSVKRNAIQWCQ